MSVFNFLGGASDGKQGEGRGPDVKGGLGRGKRKRGEDVCSVYICQKTVYICMYAEQI